jgi:hypothetical protein
VLGTGNVVLSQRVFLNKTSRTWHTDVQVNMYQATGLVVSGTSIDIDYYCSSAWCYQQAEVPPDTGFVPLNLNSPLKGSWYHAADGTSQTISTIQSIYVFFQHASEPGDVEYATADSATIRCDSSNLFGTQGPGCVFREYQPFFELSASDPAVDESAQHIQTAQQNLADHWGAYYLGGPPLERLTNQANIDRNRRAACRNFVPTGPDDSCDEYPFASTYQGAWYYPGRTSIAHVNRLDNETAGGRLGAFYPGFRS